MNVKEWLQKKRAVVQFTWQGSAECFKKFGPLLLAGFHEGGISWKRDDPSCPYPIQLRFTAQFVPFEEGLLLTSPTTQRCSQAAFLHVYFLSVATVEEYRSELPRFAEWFSLVKDAAWFILFDSSRARENKTRGHITEKIKSDVGGGQNRILEVSSPTDQRAMNLLVNTAVTHFVTSMDFYSDALSSVVLTLKDDAEKNERALVEVVNAHFNLTLLFWMVGMEENALDEMDKTNDDLNHFFREALRTGKDARPKWLEHLKTVGITKECPLLSELMEKPEIRPEDSIVTIRGFILAHQLLAALFSYEVRSQKGDSMSRESLNNFFANLFFRHTYDALNHLADDFSALELKEDFYRCVVNILWSEETIEFVDHFGDWKRLEAASEFASKLHIHSTESWKALAEHSTAARSSEWFQAWQKASKNGKLQSTTLDDVCEAIAAPTVAVENFRRSLESTVVVLKAFCWSRSLCCSLWQLIQLTLKHGPTDRVESLVDEMIDGMVVGDLSAAFLNTLVRPEELEREPKLAKLRDFCRLETAALSLKSNEKKSVQIFNRLQGGAEGDGFPFSVFSTQPTYILGELNAPFVFTLVLQSKVEMKLRKGDLTAVFTPLDLSTAKSPSALFEGVFYEPQSMARLLCVNGGGGSKSKRKRHAHPSAFSIKEGDLLGHLAAEGEDFQLTVGRNRLRIECTPRESACLTLSHVLIRAEDGREFVIEMEAEMAASPHLLGTSCFVDVQEPSVEIRECAAQSKLYAGVVQELNVVLKSGSCPVEAGSNLRISLADDERAAEFLSTEGTWSSAFHHELPAMAAGESLPLVVRMCLSIDRMNYSAAGCLAFAEKIAVEWQDKKWSFELQFTSILSIKTMSSILEDKALFEVDIERCDGDSQLTIVPKRAELTTGEEKRADDEIGRRPVLINPALEPISAGATYRLVWILPPSDEQDDRLEHALRLDYKIQLDENCFMELDLQRVIAEKDYRFEQVLEFETPQVACEIVARILSNNSQSSLCRAESTCDFVISLRSLVNRADTVVVCLEADGNYWNLIDKYKVVQLKENGLGTAEMRICPKAVGFLPYPTIALHRFAHSTENPPSKDRDAVPELACFGEQVLSFNRTMGKQIHVLSAVNQSDDAGSTHSASSANTKRSLKTQAKERLQRLFE